MLEAAQNARVHANDARLETLREVVRCADREIERLLDRAVETDSKATAKANERRIERVQAEKLEALEKLETRRNRRFASGRLLEPPSRS